MIEIFARFIVRLPRTGALPNSEILRSFTGVRAAQTAVSFPWVPQLCKGLVGETDLDIKDRIQ
jgi:hypothetical protein